jgi:hypothetical protein
VEGARASEDLLAIITRIIRAGKADLFGVTGSFFTGWPVEPNDALPT